MILGVGFSKCTVALTSTWVTFFNEHKEEGTLTDAQAYDGNQTAFRGLLIAAASWCGGNNVLMLLKGHKHIH